MALIIAIFLNEKRTENKIFEGCRWPQEVYARTECYIAIVYTKSTQQQKDQRASKVPKLLALIIVTRSTVYTAIGTLHCDFDVSVGAAIAVVEEVIVVPVCRILAIVVHGLQDLLVVVTCSTLAQSRQDIQDGLNLPMFRRVRAQ
jgi:hypothetical protein